MNRFCKIAALRALTGKEMKMKQKPSFALHKMHFIFLLTPTFIIEPKMITFL